MLVLADADRLRAARLRLTAARLAVLTSPREVGHQGADAVTAGLVRRIEAAGSPGLFEARADDNHHHPVCRSCGGVRGGGGASSRARALPAALHSRRLSGRRGRRDLLMDLWRMPRRTDRTPSQPRASLMRRSHLG